jgi:hypothetical protein
VGFVADLWLPIVLSAVLVFVVSSVVHMVLPVHRKDHARLPGEEGLLAAMRAAGVTPGTYAFPGCTSMKDMASPETVAKYDQGPVGFMTVRPNGPPAIGPALLKWFLLSLLIGLLGAYAGHHALPHGAAGSAVFRIVGTVAVAGYALGAIQDSIWKGMPWRVSAKFVVDGAVYGVVTAATFAWLWPAAV